ncbi:unnamed protein product [Effrenium voratum]|nr:unnamed protein product [Effrenium voratum]
MALSLGEAYRALGLRAELAPGQMALRQAYRRRLLEAHPDKGGDPEAFQKVRLAGELLLKKTVKAKSSPKARATPQAAGSFKGPAVKKAAAKGPQRLASLHEESKELDGFFRSLGKAAQPAPDQASSAPSNGPELLLKLRQARRLRGQAREALPAPMRAEVCRSLAAISQEEEEESGSEQDMVVEPEAR